MFCPKCGKEISNQAAFCSKCGAPLQNAGSQPAPAAAPENKRAPVESMASPVQKMAGKVHICLLLVSFILAGLWFANTIVMCDEIDYSVFYTLFSFAVQTNIIMCVLFCFNLIGSVIFFTRHVPKQDRKVSVPILSWLYWIWSVGFFTFTLCTGKAVVANNPEYAPLKVVPTALGWLYIVCCVILFGLLVYLTVLHFKAVNERKAWQKNQ